MAAANDVIYYGLIFRLPSEATREGASDVAGSGNASEWEAGGGGEGADICQRRRECTAQTCSLAACSAVGLIYGWEGGWSVGCSVGCFGRLCFVNKFHLYHSSSLRARAPSKQAAAIPSQFPRH